MAFLPDVVFLNHFHTVHGAFHAVQHMHPDDGREIFYLRLMRATINSVIVMAELVTVVRRSGMADDSCRLGYLQGLILVTIHGWRRKVAIADAI